MIPPSAPPPKKSQIRVADLVIVAVIAFLLAAMLWNVQSNMTSAGIRPGFGFLNQGAGFDLSEALVAYEPSDSYASAILAGVLNTLFLSVVCLVLSTLIGVVFGLISVGPSPIGRLLAHGYVEVFRNLPKLLVLLVLYVLAVNGLPQVRDAFSIGPFHLSNRAFNVPVLVWDVRMWIPVFILCGGVVCWRLWRRRASDNRAAIAQQGTGLIFIATLALAVLSIFVLDVPVAISVPELKGFDFRGGVRFSMQFAVIALTLGIYHGAQIAEVVRGGLSAIPKGQPEAALSLGMSRWQTTCLITLPQVIRIVIPPMSNQYVNLIKNTSISIAVGYSDLMSVSGTIINQTFRPLEMMIVTMGVYLSICVFVTTLLNEFHRRLTAREER